MNTKSFPLLLTATCLTLTGIAIESAPANAVSITANNNALALVNALLGSNSGLTVVGTPTFTGASTAAGNFTGGNISANLGLDNGVVLSTGDVTNGTANGGLVDNNNPTYTEFFGNGDAALTTIAGTATKDAAVLEFQFTSNTGNLFLLNYVFGSQEYPDFVGTQFNDAFALFVDGVNIAKIPSTNTPVSINNVNASTNSSFFRDNSTDAIGLHYGGFTTVLTAQSLNLGSGVHTFRLAIADAGADTNNTPDYGLDSAVFLKNNSFSSTPVYGQAVPEPFTVIGTLIGGTAAFRMRKKLKSNSKLSNK